MKAFLLIAALLPARCSFETRCASWGGTIELRDCAINFLFETLPDGSSIEVPVQTCRRVCEIDEEWSW